MGERLVVTGLPKANAHTIAAGVYTRTGELGGLPVWSKTVKYVGHIREIFLFYSKNARSWAIGDTLGFPPFMFAVATEDHLPPIFGSAGSGKGAGEWIEFKQATGALAGFGGGSHHRTPSLKLICNRATAAPTPGPTLKEMKPHFEGTEEPTPPPTPFAFAGAVAHPPPANPTMVPHSGSGIVEKEQSVPKQMTPAELDHLVKDLHTTTSTTTTTTAATTPVPHALACDSVQVSVRADACSKCGAVAGVYHRGGVDGNGRPVYSMSMIDGEVMRIFYTGAPGGRSHWSIGPHIGEPPYNMILETDADQPFGAHADQWKALAENIDGAVALEMLPSIKLRCASGPLALVRDMSQETALLRADEGIHACKQIDLRCKLQEACELWGQGDNPMVVVQPWQRRAANVLGSFRRTPQRADGHHIYRNDQGWFLSFREFDQTWTTSRKVGAAPFVFVTEAAPGHLDDGNLGSLRWQVFDDETQSYVSNQGVATCCMDAKDTATDRCDETLLHTARPTMAPHFQDLLPDADAAAAAAAPPPPVLLPVAVVDTAAARAPDLLPKSVEKVSAKPCAKVALGVGMHHIKGVGMYQRQSQKKHGRPMFVRWHKGIPFYLYCTAMDWQHPDRVSWVVSTKIDSKPFLLIARSRAKSPELVRSPWYQQKRSTGGRGHTVAQGVDTSCQERSMGSTSAGRPSATAQPAPSPHVPPPPCLKIRLFGLEDGDANRGCLGTYTFHTYVQHKPVYQLVRPDGDCGHPKATFLFYHTKDKMWVVGTIRAAPWNLRENGDWAPAELRFSTESAPDNPAAIRDGWTAYSVDSPPQWTSDLKIRCWDHHRTDSPLPKHTTLLPAKADQPPPKVHSEFQPESLKHQRLGLGEFHPAAAAAAAAIPAPPAQTALLHRKPKHTPAPSRDAPDGLQPARHGQTHGRSSSRSSGSSSRRGSSNASTNEMPKGRHTVVTLAIAIGILAVVLFVVISRRGGGVERAYAPVRGGDSDDEGESVASLGIRPGIAQFFGDSRAKYGSDAVTDVEMGGERRRGNARGSRSSSPNLRRRSSAGAHVTDDDDYY